MSNEKLGAEQGRALIEECGLALAAEEITCGHKHVKTFNKLNELRELAEQAYPARGAALVKEFESFAPWIIQHSDTCSYEATNGPHGDFCDCGKRERVQRWREALQKLREPGADTGTTAAPRPELAADVRPGIVAAINYCLSWYRNRHEPGFLNVALELQLRLKDGTKVFEEAYARSEREAAAPRPELTPSSLRDRVQALRPVTNMYDGDAEQRIRREGYERAKEDVLALLAEREAPPDLARGCDELIDALRSRESNVHEILDRFVPRGPSHHEIYHIDIRLAHALAKLEAPPDLAGALDGKEGGE